MPLATLHLVALSSGRTLSQFLRVLSSQSIKPLVAAKVIRWIIKPEKFSTHLANQQWDLLIIVPASAKLPEAFTGQDWMHRHWSITAGVPSRVLNNFEEKNVRLLSPQKGDVPELTGSLNKPRMSSSTQGLELNNELLSWSKSFRPGAVSMLNLLSFNPGKNSHESYQRYGKAFAESVGSKRGGNAKIVGKVVPDQKTADEDKYGWDEVALAHYPSIEHFVDMLASEDYQRVNHESRLPALRDTCILCTSEIEEEVLGGGGEKAKL